MKRYTGFAAFLMAAAMILSSCGNIGDNSGSASSKNSSAETPAQTEAREEARTEETSAAAPKENVRASGATKEEALELLPNTRFQGKYTEGEQWFSFRTGEEEEVPYTVTLENLRPGSKTLYGYLVDESGDAVKPSSGVTGYGDKRCAEAGQDGTASSSTFNELKPDTVYFVRIQGEGKAEYSLRVTDPEQERFDVTEGRETAEGSEAFAPAANQDGAQLLYCNHRYESKYEEGYQWAAFITGEEEVPYTVTLENLRPGSKTLYGYLVDEFGYAVRPSSGVTGYGDKRCAEAGQDGTASSSTFNELKPDTVYFVRIQSEGKAEYSLRVTDPEQERFDVTEGRETAEGSGAFAPAANQDGAQLLNVNQPYQSKYAEGYQWAAFTTGPEEDAPYTVSLENITVGSKTVLAYLVDEFGYAVRPSSGVTGYGDKRCAEAGQDGTASSSTFNELQPDTVYFVRIQSEGKAEYILTVTGPAADDKSSSEVTAEGTLEGALGETGAEETGAEETGADELILGTSQSSAINIPLGTKVFAKYTDGYSWLAFTTTEQEDAKYYVSLVNCTVGSKTLFGYVVDEFGNGMRPAEGVTGYGDRRFAEAEWDGTASYGGFADLKPNTTYYIRLHGDSKAEFSLLVTTPGLEKSAYSTSGSIEEAVGTLGEDEAFYTGTNQNVGPLLKHNVWYQGRYEDGYAWVAFHTGEREDTEYTIAVENTTVGSKTVYGYLFDEIGRSQKPDAGVTGYGDRRFVEAKEDGTVSSSTFKGLTPDTTYRIRIQSESKADYRIMIGVPEEEQAENTIAEELAAEETVFEVPFELNETQVRFAAESARFIDEEAAKAALEPVAKIILEHPDHPILLAGTTATDGDQAKRVELSNSRAAAVKDLMVNFFGVPEGQILTIGLGFEADPFERGRDRDSSGRFIETEGAKNRRVVVLDAEGEIARKLLGGE